MITAQITRNLTILLYLQAKEFKQNQDIPCALNILKHVENNPFIPFLYSNTPLNIIDIYKKTLAIYNEIITMKDKKIFLAKFYGISIDLITDDVSLIADQIEEIKKDCENILNTYNDIINLMFMDSHQKKSLSFASVQASFESFEKDKTKLTDEAKSILDLASNNILKKCKLLNTIPLTIFQKILVLYYLFDSEKASKSYINLRQNMQKIDVNSLMKAFTSANTEDDIAQMEQLIQKLMPIMESVNPNKPMTYPELLDILNKEEDYTLHLLILNENIFKLFSSKIDLKFKYQKILKNKK